MSIMSALLRGLITLYCHGSILKITFSRLIFIQFEASKREDLETGPFLFIRDNNTLYYGRIIIILEVLIMNVPETIAKIRLKYHLSMIDLVNAGNQLHFISDEKANNANKNHLKNCIDCYERLGVKMPKVFMDFAKE